MAIPTSIQLENYFQDRGKNDRGHLQAAISGGGPQGPTGPAASDKSLVVNVLGLPDITARCFTDTNTVTGPVMNLSQLGVPFSAAETTRRLRLEAFTSTASGGGYHETTALIRGGTAPILQGQFVGATGATVSTERVTARVENNEVIINAQGPNGVPLRWVIRCFIDEAVKVPFNG